MPKLELTRGGRKYWIYFSTQADMDKYSGSGKEPTPTNLEQLQETKYEAKMEEFHDNQCLKRYQKMLDERRWAGEYTPDQIKSIYKNESR